MNNAPQQLEKFRAEVLGDLELQKQLRETPDKETFIRLLISLGQERGHHFDAVDVENALKAAWKTWIERWID